MNAPSSARRAAWSPVGILLVVGATVGLVLLLALAVYRWNELGDSHAYWLAGRAIVEGRSPYELTTGPQVPFAYQYPPPMAQVMAPVAAVIGSWTFEYLWLALMGVCLAWLAGWRILLALALVAVLPVTIEFWYRNIDLQLAVLAVLAIRRWPAMFAVGAAIKLSPGVGIVYLAAAGRWRAAAGVAAVLAAICGVSWILAPDLWSEFVGLLAARGPSDVSGIVPIPYAVRVVAALILAVIAGRLGGQRGEMLVFVAIGVGLPTLWLSGFSFFVGLVAWLAADRLDYLRVPELRTLRRPGPVPVPVPGRGRTHRDDDCAARLPSEPAAPRRAGGAPRRGDRPSRS